jgi:hypothetical protein
MRVHQIQRQYSSDQEESQEYILEDNHSKGVHNVYMFMYHYICKLRINLISQYFPVNTSISRRPGKYEYFPLFCQPW